MRLGLAGMRLVEIRNLNRVIAVRTLRAQSALELPTATKIKPPEGIDYHPGQFGGRTAKPIPDQYMEPYEFVSHKKVAGGELKTNPDVEIVMDGQKLKFRNDKNKTHLWVAAQDQRGIEFRYGPETAMPGAPVGSTGKIPKYGHVTLGRRDPMLTGGELYDAAGQTFKGHPIDGIITNDSGRINKFFPDSNQEFGSFVDAAQQIANKTGQTLEARWFNWAKYHKLKEAGELTDEFGPAMRVLIIPNVH